MAIRADTIGYVHYYGSIVTLQNMLIMAPPPPFTSQYSTIIILVSAFMALYSLADYNEV